MGARRKPNTESRQSPRGNLKKKNYTTFLKTNSTLWPILKSQEAFRWYRNWLYLRYRLYNIKIDCAFSTWTKTALGISFYTSSASNLKRKFILFYHMTFTFVLSFLEMSKRDEIWIRHLIAIQFILSRVKFLMRFETRQNFAENIVTSLD